MEVVTEHFGEQIKHPFTWLEENSDQSYSWLKEQDKRKFEVFKPSDFKKFDYKFRFSPNQRPKSTDNHTGFIKQGAVGPPNMYVISSLHGGKTRLLFKTENHAINQYDQPNIEEYWISDTRNILIAAISHSGSDWLEFLIYDLVSFELKNKIDGIIRPWILQTTNGFYYERYDSPLDSVYSLRNNQRIAHHTFGQDLDEDKWIFANQDRTSIRSFRFTRIGKTKKLCIFHPYRSKRGWRHAISFIDLENPFERSKPFFLYESEVLITFDLLLYHDENLYFRTNLFHPNYEIVKFNTSAINDYEVLVEAFDEILVDASYLGKKHFGLTYLQSGKYSGYISNFSGELVLALPVQDGSGLFFYMEDEEPYFDLTNFHLQPQRFSINLKTLKTKLSDSKEYKSTESYKVEVKSFTADNGVQIPLYVLYHKKKVKKDGKSPALIRVYGGYGLVDHPSFEWYNRFFIDNGGVLIFPGVRGSGAKGTEWALAGRGAKKQNTIDDIISTAEYLIKEKYTNPKMLFLEGGSHGGFAVASAGIQRPELFKGIIAKAGVYDLIRLTDQSVGHAELNRVEFGDPSDSLAFSSRLKLSPIHNLRKGVKYPSFLLLTGTNDTRVVPANTYRFMESLNRKSINKLNFLHTTNGGHAIATYPYEMLQLMSFKFSFLAIHTDYKFWQSPLTY